MKKNNLLVTFVLLAFLLMGGFLSVANAMSSESIKKEVKEDKIVIAHRGASGYLPEHSLEAKSMAYAMGADYLEQDVVLTKDNRAVVLHDIHLDTVTNVAEVFPNRKRSDGRYYAMDFTLEEIKSLTLHERTSLDNNSAVYKNRFPVGMSSFKVPTLKEEIELIQGLNKSTDRNVGIYVEIKSPAWHKAQGKDITKIVLNILNEYGYNSRKDKAYLQCFDAATLKRLEFDLKTNLRLVQLIGENSWGESRTDYDYLKSNEGIKEISTYAEGIGPWVNQIIKGKNEEGELVTTDLVKEAHKRGLVVHPYTFRVDSLPDYADDFEKLLKTIYFDVGVDGIFTDFPDRAVKFLKK